MIREPGVSQFVEDHIVAELHRNHHQPRVQVDAFSHGTTAPPGLHPPDLQSGNLIPVFFRKLRHPFWQVIHGFTLQDSPDGLLTKRFPLLQPDGNIPASDPERITYGGHRICAGFPIHLTQLLQHPVLPGNKENLRPSPTNPTGHGHLHFSLGVNPDGKVSGPGIARIQDLANPAVIHNILSFFHSDWTVIHNFSIL